MVLYGDNMRVLKGSTRNRFREICAFCVLFRVQNIASGVAGERTREIIITIITELCQM